MSRPGPLAFFGFDAAEPTLLQRGVEEGWLPTVARLLVEGRAVRLAPVPSGFYNTSWSGAITGTDVGVHEAVLDRRLSPGTYRIVDATADATIATPFWKYLSDAGLRSTVANIYSSGEIAGLLGTQVHGWGTIDPYWAKLGRTLYQPPDVEELLTDAVGGRPKSLYYIPNPRTDADVRHYRDEILRSIDEHTRGLIALIDRTEWDFFFCSFDQSHQAGHLLWHLVDPAHRGHDAAADADLRDALPAIYRAVDASIGMLIERLPDEARVFVLTPHGMGPNYVSDPTSTILERGGWLVRRSGDRLDRSLRRSLWSLGRRVVPTRIRLAARNRMPQEGLLGDMQLAHVDWSRTRAFALPSDLTAYVRVNLSGREPEGTISPGREYDDVCDELVSAFSSLVHVGSGLPATEKVIRCDELLGRPVDGALPDVCAVWANHGPVRQLTSPVFGTIDLPFDDPRTGTHRHGGLVIGRGPGIAASNGGVLGENAGTLLDIAPTALSLLGVEPPDQLVGTPLVDFTDGKEH